MYNFKQFFQHWPTWHDEERRAYRLKNFFEEIMAVNEAVCKQSKKERKRAICLFPIFSGLLLIREHECMKNAFLPASSYQAQLLYAKQLFKIIKKFDGYSGHTVPKLSWRGQKISWHFTKRKNPSKCQHCYCECFLSKLNMFLH